MATTQQILIKAKELGDLIAEHEASKKLDAAISQLRDDTDAQRLMTDYRRQLQTIQEKESKGDPIEVADKHKLEELQTAVIANRVLRDLQLVQMDHLDLMRKVDDAIQGANKTEPAPAMAESPGVDPAAGT